MVQFIQENYLTILAGVGVVVILFWPQIKAAVLTAGTSEADAPVTTQSRPGCCCCPPCEDEPDKKRSDTLVEQYKIRTWLEKHRLDDGSLEACDKVIAVIASSKPRVKRCNNDES